MTRRLAAALALAICASACAGEARVAERDVAVERPAPGAASFRDLGLKGTSAKVRVTYRVTRPSGDAGQLEYAQDPPRRSFRLTGHESTFVFSEDDDFVACSDDACYRIPGPGGGAGLAGAAFLGAALGDVAEGLEALRYLRTLQSFTPKPDRTVAGRAAVCASYEADVSLALDQCLDRQTGVTLWAIVGDGGDRQTLEATAVGEPKPDDFEPTHPVEDLPTTLPTAFET